MTSTVTIIDYGVGNLLSVSQALAHVGATVNVTSDPAEIRGANRLILPGVGAFGHAMKELRYRKLVEPIIEFTATGRPFLGICVGMQIMLDTSDEFGIQKGLGLIPGNVTAIQPVNPSGQVLKVPHIGWNKLLKAGKHDWGKSILENTPDDNAVYFVHSYAACPDRKENVLAYCDYEGILITAAIQSGPHIGCQFHPEKSGSIGLGMMQLFTAI